ncbi:mechanosensitive ion channel family protein [Spirochaeta cellobiosiphila]|uniref:mechanosensitive ion channel family protein n=1 Tax=Spirochaeta cellobiosiphila TaxID=504483 RepID=UPI00042497CB|nr:mechanosensitive ion channel family protein [Spirochaeta cellobiosiphila]
MTETIEQFLQNLGFTTQMTQLAIKTALGLLLLVFMFILDFISKAFINKGLSSFVKKTKNTWDDMILESGVLTRLSHIIPALVLYSGIGLILDSDNLWTDIIQKASMVYILLMIARVISRVLDVIQNIYKGYTISKRRPIKGYLQLADIFIHSVVLILSVSLVMDQDATVLLSGLGALTAVIMLVFKDSILGLVASVQLTANNLVQIGDWIEMPKYGADGDVVDITLQTIKVQNWDKTLVTIPIYALISDSFKNWRGMSESGGRRIKRSLNLDLSSIKFLDQDLWDRLENIELLKQYLHRKQSELSKYNEGKNTKSRSNLRSLTNIGTFRAYVEAYLKDHTQINHGMTLMVRQLPATSEGLPLEVYVFAGTTVWADYESLQADIFDHLYAVLPEFELRPYQAPSGWDLRLYHQGDI